MKKTRKIIGLIILLGLVVSVGLVKAQDNPDETISYPPPVEVTSIRAWSGFPGKVEWKTDGDSVNGFYVIWSENENPTYPARSGDNYDYFQDSHYNAHTVKDFNSEGTYYVRVCEALEGKCGIYSNEVTLSFDEEASISRIEPLSGRVGTKVTIYGSGLKNSCQGRDPLKCKVGINFGGYYLEQKFFFAYDVDWRDDMISLNVPDRAEKGEIRVSRNNKVGEEYTESYDIMGPYFTVLEEVQITCPSVYEPVCGELKIQCFKEPCEPVLKTYDNRCQLDKQGEVVFYEEGGCEDNARQAEMVTESVKCVFKGPGASKPQKCYTEGYSCESTVNGEQGACTVEVKDISGKRLTWKSTCGGYADTFVDGENNYAEFFCRDGNFQEACPREYMPVCGVDGRTYPNKCIAVKQHEVEIGYHGECRKEGDQYEKSFKFAKWRCSGGEVEKWGDDSSCKRREDWKNHAMEACGVNAVEEFDAFETCGVDGEIININNYAKNLTDNNLDLILKELQELRDIVREQQIEIKYLRSLMGDMSKITQIMQDSIKNFITYGVDNNTRNLGEGERAAVIHSYKSAFDKLPEDADDLADAIKIANGRWPSATSEEAEKRAKEKFKEIYKKDADVNNPNDNAAVTVMAYGLRQKAENRNLESERAGIKIFKSVFNKLPETTDEWNTMQAITYSGAKR